VDFSYGSSVSLGDEDNIIFALEHAHRIHRIEILATGLLLKNAATVLQKSFPALTHLDLAWDLCHRRAPDPRVDPVPRDFWVDLPLVYNISA
jgi:hypothetical protein